MTVACNRAAEQFFGLGRERIIGRPFHEVVEARLTFGGGLLNGSLLKMVRRGEPISALEIDVRGTSGEGVRMAVAVVVVRGQEHSGDRFIYQLVPRPRRRSIDKTIDRVLGHDRRRCRKTVADSEENGFALGRREKEILALLALGAGTADVAESLGLSVHTVRGYLKTAFRKLGVRSRAEAVSLALQQHLI